MRKVSLDKVVYKEVHTKETLCNICERDLDYDHTGIKITGVLYGDDSDGETQSHHNVQGDICQECMVTHILPLLKLPLQTILIDSTTGQELKMYKGVAESDESFELPTFIPRSE